MLLPGWVERAVTRCRALGWCVTGNARRTFHSFTPSSKEFPKKRKERKKLTGYSFPTIILYITLAHYYILTPLHQRCPWRCRQFFSQLQLGIHDPSIQYDISDTRWRRTPQQHVNINLSIYMMHTRSIQLRTVRWEDKRYIRSSLRFSKSQSRVVKIFSLANICHTV